MEGECQTNKFNSGEKFPGDFLSNSIRENGEILSHFIRINKEILLTLSGSVERYFPLYQDQQRDTFPLYQDQQRDTSHFIRISREILSTLSGSVERYFPTLSGSVERQFPLYQNQLNTESLNLPDVFQNLYNIFVSCIYPFSLVWYVRYSDVKCCGSNIYYTNLRIYTRYKINQSSGSTGLKPIFTN